MYAGHSFDWCITNEANHQGHHSCDNSASKRDTYQSNTQVQEVYYGCSQETHRDPQGNNRWKLPIPLPNQHHYQHLLSSITELQTETSKQTHKTNNYFQNQPSATISRLSSAAAFQEQVLRNNFRYMSICQTRKQTRKQNKHTKSSTTFQGECNLAWSPCKTHGTRINTECHYKNSIIVYATGYRAEISVAILTW